MRKIGLFVLSFLLLFPLSIQAVEQQALKNDSEQLLVMSLNDDVILYEKNTTEVIPLTNMTRLLTIALAIEHSSEYKVIDELTFDKALEEALINSEGTLQLVNAIADEATFVTWLNEKVEKQGLLKTQFVNVTGEANELQTTTVQEFVQLFQQAMKLEQFARLMSNETELFASKCEELNIDDRNLVGGVYLEGDCVSIHSYNGMNLLCISLNAVDDHSISNTFDATKYYFTNYEYAKVVEKDEEIADIKVRWGVNQQRLTFVAQQDYYALLPMNFNHDDLIKEIIGELVLQAPITQNQYVGEYMVSYSNEVVLKIPLFSNLDIERNDIHYYYDEVVTWIKSHTLLSGGIGAGIVALGGILLVRKRKASNKEID